MNRLNACSLTLRQRLRAALAALATIGLLAACGGGGGVGIGGTGAAPDTFSSGPISGFGSVVVRGVHFDDAAARVEDADGNLRSAGELRLGMVVDVDSSAIVAGATLNTATASLIRFGSLLVGPLSAIDSANARLTVLGQAIDIGGDTVFDDRIAAGLAGLRVGQVLDIHGLNDTQRLSIHATRIEPASAVGEYRLRGVVRLFDGVAKTFSIGSTPVSYALAANAPVGLANGSIVRLRLLTSQDGSGRWQANSFGAQAALPTERNSAEVEGLIDSFTTAASFSVNGIAVNAAAAAFPNGSAGLARGVRVEVKGALRSGVLLATEVKIRSEADVRDTTFELQGSITSVNAAQKTFVLRGNTVDYADPAIRFDNGNAANLLPNRKVEVRGVLSPDRTKLMAQRIKFDS